LVRNSQAGDALLSRITAKQQQRLMEIDAREKEAVGRLKREASTKMEALLSERKRKRMHELLAGQEHKQSEAEEVRRAKLWAFEQEKINELESVIRDALERRPPDAKRLRRWINRAKERLGVEKGFVLEVKAAWTDLLSGIEGVEIRSRNMLGGAILTDKQDGMQVDASWDTRLSDLILELWNRWRKDVGTDHQD